MNIQQLKQLQSEYTLELQRNSKAPSTIRKYSRDIKRFLEFSKSCKAITQETVKQYAAFLKTKYCAVTCNSYLISIHAFFRYAGLSELVIPLFRIQRRNFLENELSISEYHRMLTVLDKMGKQETKLLLHTLGCTGIRVGELCFVTRQAVERGWVEIQMKGKVRRIFFPVDLRKELLSFNDGRDGIIFRSKDKTKPMNNSVVWRRLKAAARLAGIDERKVYPHNLRHMFARVYMEAYGNIAELADLLGHSSLETTRIYTRNSSAELLRRVSDLPL